jgi:hypothetical protein
MGGVGRIGFIGQKRKAQHAGRTRSSQGLYNPMALGIYNPAVKCKERGSFGERCVIEEVGWDEASKLGECGTEAELRPKSTATW